ncbi:hypothetical protein FACS1894141_7030 [Spirochaetia bacterium]|nr:hypothetical protein FACS1894141_7030 [Spirochaetia bacterium]
MQDHLPLNDLFQEFNSGTLDRTQFEGLVFQYIQEHYYDLHLVTWSKEDCTEFLCWLYPRISRSIDKYQNTGSTFDAYIGSLIRWSAKEYRSRLVDHRIIERTCWKERAAEQMVCSEEPAYLDAVPKYKPVTNPKQILILLLKSYYFLSDEFIARAAPAIGVDPDEINRLIERLREMRQAQEADIRNLRERDYSQYYRCLAYEKRYLSSPEDSAHKERMRQYMETGRKRLAHMRRRLKHMKTDASNSQIAELLGVPKGTIDASLYRVKYKDRPDDAVVTGDTPESGNTIQ